MAIARPWRMGWRERWGSVLDGLLFITDERDSDAVAISSGTTAEDFEEMFRRHEHDIFGYLWRLTSDEQTARDLTQETFLRAWQHLDRIRGYEQPGTWLFRVATNLALNHLRQRKNPIGAAASFDDASEVSQGDPAPRLALGDLVRRCLMALPPNQRAALVLREVYGMSCDEVGRALGTTTGAAKTMLWRGRERFRDCYLREDGRA